MTSTLSESSDSEIDERPSFGKHPRAPDFDNDLEDFRFPPKRRKFDDTASTYKDIDEDKFSESNNSHEDGATSKPTNVALGIMKKMGFTVGKGLGKEQQGRVEPVEAFNQKGRRGLGHDNKQLAEATGKWEPSLEVVEVQEEISWIDNKQEPLIDEEMKDWMVRGPRKETIDDEITFCDPEIVEQVVNSKSIFDNLDKHEMRRARTRSNPYETIRGAFFLNRAAVKMANIDKACDFMFTQPKSLSENDILYFADVCAGPGGFSEYVLWRRKWHAKGFGFTLRDSNDFKLDDFYAGGPETFHPFYGPKEDGDVYDPQNQEAFRQLIYEHTKDAGVHFMMSDGGFSVEGKENIQEILSKQLYLCQCLVALMIVRKGGHFVTKLFDLFTPFSVGLVYLMYRSFAKVSIFKPNTSRPANSERYLICEGKLDNIQPVVNYFKEVNECLLAGDKDLDVMELVPLEILQNDDKFFNYIVQSNNSLGQKQITGLLKIAAYCEDTSLFEHRQAQMRKECLEYWNLPDCSRIVPKNVKPQDKIETMVGSSILKILKKPPSILSTGNIDNTILSMPCDWFSVLCHSGHNITAGSDKSMTFYLGMGRTKVFKQVRDTWERVTNIELPADTFVYAEVVEELRGQYRTSRKTHALHIIDAYFLGGINVSQKPLPERHALINKFCQVLWKPEHQNYYPVRAKDLYAVDDDLLSKLVLQPCTLKNGKKNLGFFPDESQYPRRAGSEDEPLYFIPNTVMFLKSTAAPWSRHLSKTSGYHYFFNPVNNDRLYDKDVPSQAWADFSQTFQNRVEWHWFQDQSISLDSLTEAVKKKCSRPVPSH